MLREHWSGVHERVHVRVPGLVSHTHVHTAQGVPLILGGFSLLKKKACVYTQTHTLESKGK